MELVSKNRDPDKGKFVIYDPQIGKKYFFKSVPARLCVLCLY